jgi:hypothetical protein
MEPAKLKEPLMSAHPENTPNDAIFLFEENKWKKLGPFQNSELPFHVNLFLKHPIKLLTGLPTLLERLGMVELICGLEQRKTPEAVPSSNDVIRPRSNLFFFLTF